MSFEPYSIFVAIMAGLIGFSAWRYGRRNTSIRHVSLAVALMVYPYFISDLSLMIGVGALLTFFLFWPR